MTDATQVDDTTSTPDEAPVKYEPIPASDHAETVTESDLEDTPPGSEHEVAVDTDWVAQKREQEEESFDWTNLHRPPFILSWVDDDHPNGGFVIGWDTCGECKVHIRTCKCKAGPSQPKYVKNWRRKDDTHHDKPAPIPTSVRKALVEADPQVVEDAVEEALGKTDLTPTGRKRRADAGKPRGPRKNPNATPDSVAEAAGNLSAAMSKE